MDPPRAFLQEIRQLIAHDDLPAALQRLRSLLENTPRLDEAILQSARFQDIRKQIRLGTVSHAEANLTQNQIRAGLLDLLREMEERVGVSEGMTSSHPLTTALREEMERAISIVNSKNVVVGSTVSAGGDVRIGDTHHHYGDQKIPHALTQPPFLPEVFLGREDDLQRIHDQLFASDDHILLLVNGQGGVGKTSIASKYFHQYRHRYAHVAWVLSEKSIANALLLLALPLGVQFDERMGAEQRLDILLTAMANLQKPCLLVLDNANELPDLEAHYLRLRRCSNFHLLLTTRIADFERAETYRIEGLPKDQALELFEQHYRSLPPDERALFEQIRGAVGGNTLVVELLAKNLAALNRLRHRYALADLLADLQAKNLLRLAHSQEVRTGYQTPTGQMRREKPEAIIAAMYDLGELPPASTALLSVFAALPAESIPFAALETLLPGTEDLDAHLLALAQKGWIALETDPAGGDLTHFKCSPVVQEVVKWKNPAWPDDCLTLVESLIQQLDQEVLHLDNYQHSTLFARYAEAVVGGWNRNDYDLVRLCQNIGNFHADTGDLGKAMSTYQKMADIQAALFQENSDSTDFKNGLAISYSKLGETHSSLGNLDKALTYFEKDIELSKELYAAYPQNVSFKNGLAISYSQLGWFYKKQKGDRAKARFCFEKYLALREELAKDYPSFIEFQRGLQKAKNALADLDQ